MTFRVGIVSRLDMVFTSRVSSRTKSKAEPTQADLFFATEKMPAVRRMSSRRAAASVVNHDDHSSLAADAPPITDDQKHDGVKISRNGRMMSSTSTMNDVHRVTRGVQSYLECFDESADCRLKSETPQFLSTWIQRSTDAWKRSIVSMRQKWTVRRDSPWVALSTAEPLRHRTVSRVIAASAVAIIAILIASWLLMRRPSISDSTADNNVEQVDVVTNSVSYVSLAFGSLASVADSVGLGARAVPDYFFSWLTFHGSPVGDGLGDISSIKSNSEVRHLFDKLRADWTTHQQAMRDDFNAQIEKCRLTHKTDVDLLKRLMDEQNANHQTDFDSAVAAAVESQLDVIRDQVTREMELRTAAEMEAIRSQMGELVSTIDRLDHDVDKVSDELYQSVQAVRDHIDHLAANVTAVTANHQTDGVATVPLDNELSDMIETAIQMYAADRTGRFDFAMESAGGYILRQMACTKSYDGSRAFYSIFGYNVFASIPGPRAILQPTMAPGQCWAFVGSRGQVVIGLSATAVRISHVSMEHISRRVTPDNSIASAPRHFAVFGIIDATGPFGADSEEDGNTNEKLLGNFEYVDNGQTVQTFAVDDKKELMNSSPFAAVRLRVDSNHGRAEYTCIYRFRVHGEAVPPTASAPQ